MATHATFIALIQRKYANKHPTFGSLFDAERENKTQRNSNTNFFFSNVAPFFFYDQ